MTVGGRAPSIRDVARAAGVSPATVSHVYNRNGEVAEATRVRVRQVGDDLGYRPNAIGQALRSGRSRVLGIVVSHRDSAVWQETYMPYYRNVIAGAALEAVAHGYSIAASPSAADGSIDSVLPLDGVIVVDPVAPDPVVEQCLAAGTAVVTDGGYATDASHDRLRSVRPDLAHALPALLDHLAGQVSQPLRPALFVGPRFDSYSTETIEHYRRWCGSRGASEQVWVLPEDADPTAAARRFLAESPGVDAVHCLNETYAHALLAALEEERVAVPGDLQVSLTGNAYAAGAQPGAAYLHLDAAATGARCVRTLIGLIEGDDPGDTVFDVELVPSRRSR